MSDGKKKWKGKGQFFCAGMSEHNGKIRTARVEAEDEESACALIRVEVARQLKLDLATFARMVTVLECEEVRRHLSKTRLEPSHHLHKLLKAKKKKALHFEQSGPKPQQVPPIKLKKGRFIDI